MQLLSLIVYGCCILFVTIFCFKSEKKIQNFSLFLGIVCALHALLLSHFSGGEYLVIFSVNAEHAEAAFTGSLLLSAVFFSTFIISRAKEENP